MANSAVKVPLFRAISAHTTPRSFFCSHAKLNPIAGTLHEVETTSLPNKLMVAAADTGSPITRLSYIFKAGPRYETYDSLGASHYLRAATGLATKTSTSFSIVRNLQQVGANLTCTQDRETIAYTLSGTYEAVTKCGSLFLNEIVSCPVFKPWELDEIVPRMKLELACMGSEVKAMELLHAAAYRTGLGNSLFAARHCIGKMSPESLQYYVYQNMTSDRGALIGLGISASELAEIAAGCNLVPQHQDCSEPCQYHGSLEARRERGGDLAYVTIAAESGGMKDWLVYEVLKNALGTGSRVQWGNESGSILNKVTSKYANGEPSAVSAFSCSYAQSGLFGIMVVNGSCSAGEVVRAAAQVLKAPSLTDKDIARAKQITKLDGLLRLESGESCITQMGRQALFCPKILTPQEFSAAVDKISTADVQQAAEKVSRGKFTMASVGNLCTVPYLDQLK